MKLIIFLLIISVKTFALVDFKINGFSTSATLYSTENYSEHYAVKIYQVQLGKLQELKEELLFPDQQSLDQWIDQNNLVDNENLTNILNFLLTSTEDVNKSIWQVTEQWNDTWEEKYSQWVASEVGIDFFKDNNIEVDCADVAYALRWIFSRMHHLPMFVTFDGSGVKFSNLSFKKSWTNLKTADDWNKDQLFLASLKYVLGNTGTKTVERDTIPVKVTPENFKPGLINFLGYHTQIIYKVDLVNPHIFPAFTFESTVPAASRTLYWNLFLSGANIRKFNGPNEEMVDQKAEAQSLDVMQFIKNEKIEKDWNKIKYAVVDDIIDDVKRRDSIVNEGFKICQDQHCVPGTSDYENWSTPSRDQRILTDYKKILSVFDQIERLNTDTEKSVRELVNDAEIELSFGKIKIADFFSNLENKLISSDPGDDIDLRWALDLSKTYNNIILKLKNNIKIRKSFLKDAKPCTNCIPNRPEWKKLETYLLDDKIRSQLATLITLCNLNISACGDEGQIDRQLGISKKEIWQFSSSPAASFNERWGKQALPIISKYFPTMKVKEISDGIFMTENEILNIYNDKKIQSPFTEDFEEIGYRELQDNNLILLYINRNNFILDKKAFTLIKLPSIKIEELFDGYILTHDYENHQYSVYAVQNNNLVLMDTIKFESGINFASTSEYYYDLKKKNNSILFYEYKSVTNNDGTTNQKAGYFLTKILYIKNSKVQIQNIDVSLNLTTSDIVHVMFDNQYLLLLTKNQNNNYTSYLLNQTTGEIKHNHIATKNNCSIQFNKPGIFICMPSGNNDELGELFVYENLNTINKYPVTSYQTNKDQLLFTTKNSAFKINGNSKVEKLFDFPEGMTCSTFNFDNIACFRKEMNQLVIGNKVKVAFYVSIYNQNGTKLFDLPINTYLANFKTTSDDIDSLILLHTVQLADAEQDHDKLYFDITYKQPRGLNFISSQLYSSNIDEEDFSNAVYISAYSNTKAQPMNKGILVIKYPR